VEKIQQAIIGTTISFIADKAFSGETDYDQKGLCKSRYAIIHSKEL